MTTKYDKDVEELLNGLNSRQGDLELNEAYYDATHRVKAIGLSTPPEMRHLTAAVGWPRVYLDTLEERLDLESFRMTDEKKQEQARKPNPALLTNPASAVMEAETEIVNDVEKRIRSWWQANMLDVESGLGHLEAMTHGEAYITVSAPDESLDEDPEIPIYKVESPFNFYAERDYRSGRVKRAIRSYKPLGYPASPEQWATLLLPDETVILKREQPASQWRVDQVIAHGLGRPLVAPLINRESLRNWSGSSEITTELRSATDMACRIMMNMGGASELMAHPQRVLFGITQEDMGLDPGNPSASMDAYLARILAFENHEAKAFQFSAADLRNYVDVLQEISKHVASYTGLPPQYLSFSSENPASAEAINASEARLVKKAERKSRMFGRSWEEAMRLGMLVMDGKIPQDAYKLESVWRDPATPTFSAKADGITKLHAAGIIPTEQSRIDLGYTDLQREQMRVWDKENPMNQLNALLGAGAGPQDNPDDQNNNQQSTNRNQNGSGSVRPAPSGNRS